MFGNLGGMLNKVQEIQNHIQNLKSEMEQSMFEGSSGNGLVKISLNGKLDPVEVLINPDLQKSSDNPELNRLVLEAIEDATKKVKDEYKRRLNKLTGGIHLPPGIGLPF